MSNDQINALFELGSAILGCTNIYKTYIDKGVKGYNYGVLIFYTLWCFYNFYFYPMNDLWYSFYAGIAIGLVNMIWLIEILYYKSKEVKSKNIDIIKNTYRWRHE